MQPIALLVSAALAVPAAGQCNWLLQPTGQGLPGVDGSVTCSTTWDPDGAGPLPPLLVLGGEMTLAGNVVVDRVTTFDLTTQQFQPLGQLDSYPRAFAVMPNGTLVVCGSFYGSGEGVLEWNGTAWQPFAGGSGGTIPAAVHLAVAGGDLFAISRSYQSTWVTAVHRHDGVAWQQIGVAGGLQYAEAFTLCALANGDLVVGGYFGAIGGVTAAGVARWDGSAWHALGSGALARLYSIAELANGDLVVGGYFSAIGGVAAANIARWDGLAWHALGSGTAPDNAGSADVRALLAMPNGDVVAGGDFAAAGGQPAFKVARWNGTSWSAMGGGIALQDASAPSSPLVTAWSLTAAPNGDVIAGGIFPSASGRDATNVARFDGSDWQPLVGDGIGNRATCAAFTENGDLLLGGAFRDIDGAPVNGIARWNGVAWQALGGGVAKSAPGRPAFVADVLAMQNGDIVVCGDFDLAGGAPASQIARWDGVAWHPLGSGMNGINGFTAPVAALAETADGELIAGGTFTSAGGVAANGIARWDGAAWHPLGGGLQFAEIGAVGVLPDGDIVALESSPQVSRLHLWDGTTWQLIGQTANGFLGAPAYDLAVMPDGAVIIGGAFLSIGGTGTGPIARWHNGLWSSLAGGPTPGWTSTTIFGLEVLPDGDLLAVGYVNMPGQQGAIARWDGATWSALFPAEAYCSRVAVGARGQLAGIGGNRLDGTLSMQLFRARTTCPADVVAGGSGCAGSGGSNQLTAAAAPWLGATFSANASGMPQNGLVVEVFGVGATNTPLDTLVPQALTGCALLVQPDVLRMQALTGNAATVTWAIPDTAALAGGAFGLQVVAFELSPTGDIAAVTASNRLTATIGAL